MTRSRFWCRSLAAVALATCTLPVLADIPAAERAVLLALYDATAGDGWSSSANWKTDPATFNVPGTECTWEGIVCNGDRVTEIHLSGHNLVGSLPDLSPLTELTRINVSDNAVTGELPDLSVFTQLRGFWASNNQFSGFLPALPASLNVFWVMNNQLVGPIPGLAGLTALNDFRVSTNRLTGTPPTAPASLNAGGSSLCPNLLHAPSPTDAAWSTATGETDWSRWCTPGYLVTPSAGAGGSIAPTQASALLPGDTVAFTVTAEAGYLLDSVTGSCGGTLVADTFTTDPVSADCTVVASFRAEPVVPPTASTKPVPAWGVWGLLLTGLLAAGLGAGRLRR